MVQAQTAGTLAQLSHEKRNGDVHRKTRVKSEMLEPKNVCRQLSAFLLRLRISNRLKPPIYLTQHPLRWFWAIGGATSTITEAGPVKWMSDQQGEERTGEAEPRCPRRRGSSAPSQEKLCGCLRDAGPDSARSWKCRFLCEIARQYP